VKDEHADIQAPGLNLGAKQPRVPDSIERAIAGLLMAVLALITIANVIARYTATSFAWTEEYSVALMVVMTMFGAAAAFAGDRHIRLTFLVEKLPRPAQRRIEFAVLAASFAVFAILVVYGARLTWDEYRFDDLSPGLGVPRFLYTIWLPLLSLLAVLRIVGRAIRIWRVRER
jgi:TRAP-type C4-dicarboxylate transport system permease small subunit